MKIYTKTGDKGNTTLYDSTPISKGDLRVESYGTIDELNSAIGLAKAHIEETEVKAHLEHIQRKLFNVAGELATLDGKKFPDRIEESDVADLEEHIEKYLEKIGKDRMFQFIIPGTNPTSGFLHMARTICRRAERRIVNLAHEDKVSPVLVKYINRLSDYLYSVARVYETKEVLVEFGK